jgi:hypothetical protein
MSRPRAYTIAALLLLFACLIGFTSTVPALAQGAGVGAIPEDRAPFIQVVLELAAEILGIMAVYGIWRMQKWGVVLGIVVAAFNALINLPPILFAPLPVRLVALVAVVWSAAIIVLLLRPVAQPSVA